MVEFFTDPTHSSAISFAGSTLVLPSLTIGNVGQLTLDLLVSTANIQRVGFIEDEHVVPMAGNDTFTVNQGKLSCAVEVFYHPQSKTTFIQQRSPVAKGYNRIFAKKLVEWIRASAFKEVVLLASADASYRNDVQLSGQQLRHVANGINEERLAGLLSKALEKPSFDLLFKQGGLTEGIYQESVEAKVPILVLAIFCSEGDNIPDAIQLSEAANQFLKLVQSTQWKPPNSWTLIQGNTYDNSLFQ